MSTATGYERTLLLADTADTAELTALAERRGWRLDYLEAFSNGVSQRVWVVGTDDTKGGAEIENAEIEDGAAVEDGEGPQTLVRELEHHRHGTRFVSVSGADVDTVSEVASAVTGTVETTALDTVLERLRDAATSPVELLRGLRLLASAHFMSCLSGTLHDGPLDPRYGEVFERLLSHRTSQVRLTTMLVIDHLRPIAPEFPALVLARQGVEEEHDHLVEAFVAHARQEGERAADTPS